MIFPGSWQTNSNMYIKGQIHYCGQNTLKEDKEGRRLPQPDSKAHLILVFGGKRVMIYLSHL